MPREPPVTSATLPTSPPAMAVPSLFRRAPEGGVAHRDPWSGAARDADLEALLGARVAAHLAPGARELDAARRVEDAQVDVGPLPGDLREGALGEADLEVAVGGAHRVSEQVVLQHVEVVG